MTANAVFTISLSNNGSPVSAANAVSINYQTQDGSAAAGTDYVHTAGTATISQGSSSTIIPIPISGEVPATISFTAPLSAATSGTLTTPWAGAPGTYVITFDNNTRQTVQITASGATSLNWVNAVTTTTAVAQMSSQSITQLIFESNLQAATSGTLTSNWAGITGAYAVTFSNGSINTVNLTNSMNTATWLTAVTASSVAAVSGLDKRFRLCLNSATGAVPDAGSLSTYTAPTIPALSFTGATIDASTNSMSILSASGNQIVDSTGTPIRLKTIAWYGFEGTDILPHGMYTNRSYTDILDQIKIMGFNTIRLPFCDDMVYSIQFPTSKTITTSWGSVTVPAGGYFGQVFNSSYTPPVYNITSGNFYVGTNNQATASSTSALPSGINPLIGGATATNLAPGAASLVGATPMQALDAIISYGASIGLRFILDHHRISMYPINAINNGIAATIVDSGYGTDGWPYATVSGDSVAVNNATTADLTATHSTYLYGGLPSSVFPAPSADLPQSQRTYTAVDWANMWSLLADHCTNSSAYANGVAASIIGIDPHNEPHYMEWSVWASMCETLFTNTVNPINPNWMMFVEGVATGYNADNNASYWWGGYLKDVQTRPVNLVNSAGQSCNNKLCYSVHEYAHSVNSQTWLSSVASSNYNIIFTDQTVANYPNNLPGIWDEYWGFIFKGFQYNGSLYQAPIWIGEFGFGAGYDYSTGALDPLQTNYLFERQWADTLVKYLNGFNTDGTTFLSGNELGMSFSYFALNPESGNPLGGLLLNKDYQTIQTGKMNIILPLLS